MNDPLLELAEANVELGNRPPQPVVRRSMTAADYAAQQLAASVPGPGPTIIQSPPVVIINREALSRREPPEMGFSRAFWITAGILVAIFVFGLLFGGINRIIEIGQERQLQQQQRPLYLPR